LKISVLKFIEYGIHAKNTMEHSVLEQQYNGANMVHVQNKLYKG